MEKAKDLNDTTQIRALKILLKAVNETMSYSDFTIRIKFDNLTEQKIACSMLIGHDLTFKIHANYTVTIYRGLAY